MQLALAIDNERRTQKEDVIHYIRKHGSLTRKEAFEELGICELSSRIIELERDGYRFDRENVKGQAKNGRKWCVVRYRLCT